ncbi:MAG: mycothiol synthase [Acidimicrobiales bacterium]
MPDENVLALADVELATIESSAGERLSTVEVDRIRAAFSRALPVDVRDDRFSDSWADETDQFIGTVAMLEGNEIGYVGGRISSDVIQLDAFVASDTGVDDADLLGLLLGKTLDRLKAHPDRPQRVELWAKPALDGHADAAEAAGFDSLRALHQMRCALPAQQSTIATRSFLFDADADAFLRVNNRAFEGHPDQGNMSRSDLDDATSEPWFNADGIRLYEEDGQIAGFCWTKIHAEQQLGEIYAIGIDPDFHGKGLGVPMTAAGLDWLSEQGLTTGMLYVEADNDPALRTYDRLGFTIFRTDRAWLLPNSL